MWLRYQLARPEGVAIGVVHGTVLEATGKRGRTHFDTTNPRIAQILANLDQEDISEVELYAIAAVLGAQQLQDVLNESLSALKRVQALNYVVCFGRQTLARILPLGKRAFWDRKLRHPSSRWILCTEAYFRVGKQGLHIHSPNACAEVIVEPSFASQLMAWVCDPCACASPSHPAVHLLQQVLADTGHLTAGGRPVDARGVLWSFPDLLFHSTSRMGHEWGGFGRRTRVPHPPIAKRSSRVLSSIDLRAVLALRPRSDATFTTILAARRSRRYPAAKPLSLPELASVLSLAAEPIATDDPSVLWRYPYPSGGGIYGYHIYIAIHRCLDLDPGLYRHNAEDRTLERLEAPPSQIEQLVTHCASALGLDSAKPDTVLILTADIAEFSASYDAIAYRLVILGAGCLIQNLSLAASALGLAGCAVGGCSPILFTEIVGADPLYEPSVAEFALSGGAV